ASVKEDDTALALKQSKEPLGLPAEVFDKLNIRTLLREGLGNQIAFHLYDSPPLLDINIPMLVAWALGQGAAIPTDQSFALIEALPEILELTGPLHPVYISVPVRDRRIVDDFLDRLDRFLAAEARVHGRMSSIDYAIDFYKLNSTVKSK